MHEPVAVHMQPLVTPQLMADLDRRTIEAGTPAEVLMERAGRAVARLALQVVEGRYGKSAVVVCGTGNNGGDGFVAARVLRNEGMKVRCLVVGDAERVSGPAAHHLDAVRRRGVPVVPFDPRYLEEADVVVDALFGTGFHGQATGDGAKAIDAINSVAGIVISVDIPSGVDGETGAVAGPAVRADLTLAMGAEKIGAAVGEGAIHSGVVGVADIGIPVFTASALKTTSAEVGRVLPARRVDAHKRSMGSVALLGGSTGMSGAMILASGAAMRSGAGYVTAGVTSAVQEVVATALPEVLTRVLTEDETLGPQALEEFKPVLERATALGIGPGLGQGEGQQQLVARALETIDIPIVLDADALNVLASDVGPLQARRAACVITPHPAELARLMGSTVEEIQADRVHAVRTASERFGCTVVLKGFRTVISASGGNCIVNPTGAPSLATAGTGDVLTGIIAALLAQGMDVIPAAFAGTYVHGLAGEIAGEEGAIAGDVVDALPQAFELVRRGAR